MDKTAERSVNDNSNNFCNVNNDGNANNNNANNSNDVRPGFCVASSRISSERASDTEGAHILAASKRNLEADEFDHIGAISIRRSSIRYECLLNDEAILKAFKQARRQSHYKPKVQSFDWYSIRYCYLIKQSLKNKTYEPDDVIKFKINERGKLRNIEANSVRDRVVNNLLVNEVLTPLTNPLLLFDNGASRRGFGISHSRARLEKHLRDSYLNYGKCAVIDVFDLSKYFDSIYVPYLLTMYRKLITDDDIFNLLKNQIVKHNGLDNKLIDYAQQNITEYYPKLSGMGIGSVISQNAGIFYPTLFDNWVTKVCGNKYYGRYMDDFYIICPNIEVARYYKHEVPKYLNEKLYLTVNKKKTQISYLTHGFKYLKNFYKFTSSGKLYCRSDNDSFKRERRKLRKFKNTKMTGDDIVQSYKAWRGNMIKNKYNEPRVRITDEVFKEIYPCLFNKLELGE